MRILHVVPSYYPAVRYGGPIRSVHGLAVAQVQLGHQVDVFTTDIDGPSNLNVPLNVPVSLDGVNIHYFPISGIRRLCTAPTMVGALREKCLDTDIIHLHSVYLWPTYAAARAASRKGVPYILAPRGMLVSDLIERKNSLIKRLWIAAVEKRTLRQAAGIHVTTETERRDLERLGLALAPAYCVPNGISLPMAPKKYSRFDDLIGDRPYVLYVGRLNWKKGLDRLIAAWQMMQTDMQLVLAGNDEDGYRDVLQRQIRQAGAQQRIVFLGEVADDEKWDLYQRATLFVLPSISENFGNVVLEAMLMSCPVLVSTGVGLADAVTQTQCGIACSNEPAVLAREMSALLRNPELSLMGKRGRQVVMENYSWQSVARMMEQVYQDISQPKSSRHFVMV